ncbi:MAG: flavin reductase family protein [Pseudomonadota bacterium]
MNVHATVKDENDSAAFRRALGCFPTGVAIVTTLDKAGQPVGLTVSSFNSVSMDPPLILWSLMLDAGCLSAFKAKGSFAVNVLAADQTDLAKTFSSAVSNRFKGVDWRAGRGGIPLLGGVAARFECDTHDCLPGGDHVIFLGHVRGHSHSDRPPMVYGHGRFGSMAHV